MPLLPISVEYYERIHYHFIIDIDYCDGDLHFLFSPLSRKHMIFFTCLPPFIGRLSAINMPAIIIVRDYLTAEVVA